MNRNRKLTKTMALVLSGAVVATGAGAYTIMRSNGSDQAQTENKITISKSNSDASDDNKLSSDNKHDSVIDNATKNENDTSGSSSASATPKVSIKKNPSANKEETVYVKTDSTGKITEVIVSDWLKNANGADSIEDSSNLKNISNIKGDETFTQSGDKIVWDAKGNDIYYQGTSTDALPVNISLNYYLDDKEIQPSDLAGKSGHLKVKCTYTNIQQTGDVYVPFIAVTGMVFSSDVLMNASVDNGKVISDGNSQIILGIGMPGMQESLKIKDLDYMNDLDIPSSFTLEGDVKDFEMSMSMSVVSPINLSNLNLDDLTTDDLVDTLNELTDASTQLVDGSGELRDGIQTLKDSCKDLIDGMDTIDENMGKLDDGISTLDSGASSLASGAAALVSGIDTLDSNKGSLVSGTEELASGAGQVSDGAHQLSEGAKTIRDNTKTLSDGAKTLANGSGAKQLSEGAESLKTGAGNLSTGMKSLYEGIQTMINTIKSSGLTQGAASLDEGTTEFAAALKQYTDGVDTLLSALNMTGTFDPSDPTSAGYTASINYYIDNSNAVLSAIKPLLPTADSAGTTVTMDDIVEAVMQIAATAYGQQANASDVIAPASDTISQESVPSESDTGEEPSSADLSLIDLNDYSLTLDGEDIESQSISDQGVSDIEAVLGELQGVQGLLSSLSVEELMTMKDSYPEYVGKLENCIDLLSDALGSISVETYTSVSDESIEAVNEELASISQEINSAITSYETASGTASQTQEANDSEIIPEFTEVPGQMAVNPDQMANLINLVYGYTFSQSGATVTQEEVQALIDMGNQLKELTATSAAEGTAKQATLRDAYLALTTENADYKMKPSALLNYLAGQISDGASTLNQGINTLVGSVASSDSTLLSGAKELYEGSQTLYTGADSLNSGLKTYIQGAETLSKGASALYTGTNTLYKSSLTLAEGADSLESGAYSLYNGAETLSSGIGQLSEGGHSLSSGAYQLESGTSELSQGSSQLKEGTQKLSDGGSDLDQGVDKLADGSNELADGMKEFDEEAIQKISDTFEKDSDIIINRLKEIRDAGNDYQLFTSDDNATVSGNVKFIIETDPIEIN